ncbi:ERVV1 protein, partial [Ramphastos sulfuratus]|nr:ERVV1 protein [Ramphastos sulfuratus]
GCHSFVPALIPALGVAQLEKAIVNISATMEIITNSTADALQRLKEEAQPLSREALQTRLPLDIITAQMGGLCPLVTTLCCTSIDQSGHTETDIQ